jgi:hypothetical protein
MTVGTLAVVASIGGVTLQKTITETFDHPNPYVDIPLLAGKAVTDWVKTDANTAAGNLTAGHGYSSGKVDVYWTGGMRYDVDMIVTVNAIALDGGSGTDFPANGNTTVVVCTHQQINTAIDGDNAKIFVANSTKHGHLHFEDGASDVIANIELQADNPYTWNYSSGQENPLTGDPIAVCYASNGTIIDCVLTILSGEDSTP